MDIKWFWELINKTRIASNGDTDKQAQLIIQTLEELQIENIIEYEHIFYALFNYCDRYNLRDAASFIGEFGDSGWKDFRAWLICQGQEVYESVIDDPDILGDIISVDDRYKILAESLLYVGQKAYVKKLNNESLVIPYIPDNKPVPKGESLWKNVSSQEDYDYAFMRKYPKVWAKFN